MAEAWGRSTFSTVLGQICYVGYTIADLRSLALFHHSRTP